VFILCALAMAVLVLRWTGDALAGAVAGAIYAFAPVRLTCWAWMHVLVTFCFPLLLLAIEGVLWGRPLVGILLLGLLLVSQVVLTVYGAAFAAVTMLIFTAAYVLGLGRPRPWRRLALLPLAAVATLPLLLVLFHVYGSAVVFPADGTLGAALGRQAASLFALDPLASLAELGERFARVAGLVRQAPGPGDAVLPLDAGRPALVLAPIGIWSLLRAGDRRDRSRALGIGALVVVGLALAVGPGFMPVPFAAIPLPIVWLGELPVFGWLRSPERYVLVALVGLAAAAAFCSRSAVTARRCSTGRYCCHPRPPPGARSKPPRTGSRRPSASRGPTPGPGSHSPSRWLRRVRPTRSRPSSSAPASAGSWCTRGSGNSPGASRPLPARRSSRRMGAMPSSRVPVARTGGGMQEGRARSDPSVSPSPFRLRCAQAHAWRRRSRS